MKKTVLGAPAPKEPCTDQKCPFHGQIGVKKELFKGKVVKKDINRSATIEMFKSVLVPKYERYQIKRSRIRVHNPACLDAKVGDEVLVARTRPLSKVKNHVIIQILGREELMKTVVKEEKKKSKKKKIEALEEVKEEKTEENESS